MRAGHNLWVAGRSAIAGAPGSLADVVMSERGLDADSFLTQLDGRLRAIQAELRPGVALPALTLRAMVEPGAPAARRGRSGPLSALLGRSRPEPAAPADEPPAPQADEEPRELDSAELLAQVKDLTETQMLLVAASERLLEAFAHMIESPPGLFSPMTPVHPGGVEIEAGPFADTEAMRAFEGALEQLEAVRRVTVRGYAGSDRAVFDVELQGQQGCERGCPDDV